MSTPDSEGNPFFWKRRDLNSLVKKDGSTNYLLAYSASYWCVLD
jgi:hypothetical protein